MSVVSPGAVIDERFVVEQLAGAGGMGRVFRGRDLATGQAVAIKVLGDDAANEHERFRREAELLRSCRHPSLAEYVNHGTWRDTPYLVQTWIDGVTLASYFATTGCTVRDAVVVVRAVAEGVGVLHAQGVIHRDVKPTNIILVNGDIAQPRLVDLGVARRYGGDSITMSLTRTGAFVGTPGYTSPEQALGRKHVVGPPTDIFALGTILYECLTGMPAFAGINALARNTKVLLADPLPVATYCAEAPRQLTELLDRMLDKDPATRVGSIASLLAALPGTESLPDETRRWTGCHDNVQTMRLDMRAPPRMALRLAPGDQLACVILAIPSAQHLDEIAEDSVSTLAAGHGVTLRLHADGSLTGLLAGGDPSEVVGRAARCAMALGRELGGAPIVLVSSAVEGSAPNATADPLEWAFVALEVAAVRIAMAPDSDGPAIQLDERTARILPREFTVTRVGDGFFLVGEAA